MTHTIKRPQVALLGEASMSQYAGTNLWQHANGSNVQVNALTNSVPHSDIIAFLNGYGSTNSRRLNAILAANKPSAMTTLTCGIDSNNRFFLEGSSTFALASSGTYSESSRAMFGFTGTETVTGSGPYRLTAAGRWKRGVFQTDYDTVGGLKIQTPGTPTTVFVSIMLDGTPITNDPSFPGKTLAQFDFSSSLASDYDDLEVGGFMVGSNEQGDGANTFEILNFKYNSSHPFNITHIVFDDPDDNLSGSMDFTYQFNFTGTNQGYQGTITNISIHTTINYTEGQAILFQPGPSWQFQNGVPAGFENHNSTTPYNWTGDQYSSLMRIGGTLTAPDGTQYAIIRKSGNSLSGHPITTLTASEINAYITAGGTWSYTNQGIQTVHDVVPSGRRVQNLPTWIRNRGLMSDADDVYGGTKECLEAAMFSVSMPEMTCVLEEDGRVSLNYPTSSAYGLFQNISATGKRLLQRLGFDGTETVTTTTANHSQIKAANRAPCALSTKRGYVELRREVSGRDDYVLMADGSVVSSGFSPTSGWSITFRVSGPPHGYAADMERHLRGWWSHARRGLTIYPTFGDPDNPGKGGNDTRRHVDKHSIYVDSNNPLHNLFHTAEADEQESHFGKRVGGRLLVRRHPSDSLERAENYSGQLDIHQDIQMRFLDDPTR